MISITLLDFLYFVLLVGALIFIHEFGHFVVAKLFGVKVLTFSIGFGPKIIRLRGRETEYCLGLLPFGGFVRMLEESTHQGDILPEDRKRTLESQALWKRFLIVIAGPAMNILFPVVLYASLFWGDKTFFAPYVGSVEAGYPAEGKLLPGDKIISLNGSEVSNFPEIERFVAAKAGVPIAFTVERDGKRLEVWVTPKDEARILEPEELELVAHEGKVGVWPGFAAPVVGIAKVDSPAFRSGLRTFDRVVSVNGRRMDRLADLVLMLSQNRGDTVVLTYLRPVPVAHGLGALADFAVFEPGVVTLTPAPKDPESRQDDYAARERDVLARVGIESSEMYVSFVPEGSSEWQAGLRPMDRIVSLDGVAQKQFRMVEASLKAKPSETHELSWVRGNETLSGRFAMRKESWSDENGQTHERYVFRTMHWLPLAPPELVDNPHPLAYATSRGIAQTGEVIKFILVGFMRIAQGRVSLAASMGGPIRIYELAGDAGARGASDFVWAMALVSVNLGLVNLLPIPVLDGGHLAFLGLEAVSRKKPSVRVRELASLAGMTFLGILMVIAFKNDVSRRWDDILVGVRDLFG